MPIYNISPVFYVRYCLEWMGDKLVMMGCLSQAKSAKMKHLFGSFFRRGIYFYFSENTCEPA